MGDGQNSWVEGSKMGLRYLFKGVPEFRVFFSKISEFGSNPQIIRVFFGKHGECL